MIAIKGLEDLLLSMIGINSLTSDFISNNYSEITQYNYTDTMNYIEENLNNYSYISFSQIFRQKFLLLKDLFELVWSVYSDIVVLNHYIENEELQLSELNSIGKILNYYKSFLDKWQNDAYFLEYLKGFIINYTRIYISNAVDFIYENKFTAISILNIKDIEWLISNLKLVFEFFNPGELDINSYLSLLKKTREIVEIKHEIIEKDKSYTEEEYESITKLHRWIVKFYSEVEDISELLTLIQLEEKYVYNVELLTVHDLSRIKYAHVRQLTDLILLFKNHRQHEQYNEHKEKISNFFLKILKLYEELLNYHQTHNNVERYNKAHVKYKKFLELYNNLTKI